MKYNVLEAPSGTKLKFLNANGWEHDAPDAVKAGLVEGEQYTLDYLIMESWSSKVKLKEFTDLFNSVMFESAPYDEPETEWYDTFRSGGW